MTAPSESISVCVPTFEGGAHIEAALCSVLEQGRSPDEIIVMDDGSRDETVRIAREVLAGTTIPNVVERGDHVGLVGNWNRCADRARSDVIKFLFQDDLLEPGCLGILDEALRGDPGTGFSFCRRRILPWQEEDALGRRLLESCGRVHREWEGRGDRRISPAFLSRRDLFRSPLNRIGEPSAVLIRRGLLRELGGFDPEMGQLADIDLWIRALDRTEAVFVDRPLVSIRIHPGQESWRFLREEGQRSARRRYLAKHVRGAWSHRFAGLTRFELAVRARLGG